MLLDNLAAGIPTDRLLANYPTLTAVSVHAALAYAGELARERVVAMPQSQHPGTDSR